MEANSSKYSRVCKKCGVSYNSFELFLNHVGNCKSKMKKVKKFQCEFCVKSFDRSYNFRRHLETMHANDAGMNGGGLNRLGRLFTCGICNINLTSRAELKQHRQIAHERNVTEFREVETAHQRIIRVYRMDYPENIGDVTSAFKYSHSHVCAELERQSSYSSFFKFGLVLSVEFIKIDEENCVSQSTVVPFRSKVIQVLPMNNIDQELTEAYELIQNSVLSFVEKGSGWIVDEIMHLDMEVMELRFS